MIKVLIKLRGEGHYLNIIKSRFDKPTANIVNNGEKPEVFSLRYRTKQGCPFLPCQFKTVLKVLVKVIRLRKKKSTQIGKEEGKLSLLGDYII